MIVMENGPELDVRSDYKSKIELLVERTDISFYSLSKKTVRIEVTVSNLGEERSGRALMRLESAPLGAFVPWQPLTQLVVPPLEPGESSVLSVDVVRPESTPLGDFDRVPPNSLLTAVSSPDQPDRPARNGLADIFNLLRRGQTSVISKGDPAGKPTLAPDLLDLMKRDHPHWAGNINVFVGKQAVERHLARALRIYPGRPNLAMFLVGTAGERDAYSFELVGLAPNWKAGLFDMMNSRNFLLDPSNRPIQEGQWIESNGGLMVILATHPPANREMGNLAVHVTRRSSGNEAIVEFNLDPAAQGTGCYFV